MNRTTAAAHSIRKLVYVIGFFVFWIGVYKFLNEYNADPARAVYLTRPADVWPWVIQPWTSFIYVFLGVAFPILPICIYWKQAELNQLLTAYMVSSLVAFSIYAFWPLAITRPEFSGRSVGTWLMRTVIAVDNEANCFPSFHTSYAILGALFLAKASRSRMVLFFLPVAALAVCVTTITTGQHYLIDVLGGGANAFISYFASHVIARNWSSHASSTTLGEETQRFV